MAYIDSSFNQFLPGVVTADEQGTVCQENHYYPYGDGFADARIPVKTRDNRYKFCGKEEDSGSGLYDFSARFLNPVAGRFLTLDPAAGETPSLSPYLYCAANPLNVVDPDGRHLEVRRNEDGTYTIEGGQANSDRNIYLNYGTEGQSVIGTMLTEYSFMNDEGKPVEGAVIDMGDTSGQEFLENNFIGKNPRLISYAAKALPYGEYDFKSLGITRKTEDNIADKHRHRGMKLVVDGIEYIASARDVGNFAAGYVAGWHLISWEDTRKSFDLLETVTKFFSTWEPKWYIEGQPSQLAQYVGYSKGFQDAIAPLTMQYEYWK